eukprot:Skav223814  [mRNA]  locus=scaffold575:916501:950148:+ [translate_table: standard]
MRLPQGLTFLILSFSLESAHAALQVASSCSSLTCGVHGTCRNGACECQSGWAGKDCSYFMAEDTSETVELSPELLRMLEAQPGGFIGGAEVTPPSPPSVSSGATGVTVATGAALKVAREALVKAQQAAQGVVVTSLVQMRKPEEVEAPSPEATVKCEADCSGHGTCEESGCVCGEEWTGTCRCTAGFSGPNCSQVVHQRSSVVVKLKTSRPSAPRPGMDGFEEGRPCPP